MFTLRNLREKAGSLRNLDVPGLIMTPHSGVKNKVAKYDFTFYAYEEEEGISCVFQYSTRLFSRVTIELMRDRFLLLLEQVLQDPSGTIGELEAEIQLDDEPGQVSDIEFDF